MNIDRHNYEEYFLLYADNELTDSEKAEVLMFVKHNKDLEEEFRMIHHTISKPDMNLELTDKSFLFRTTQTKFINENNYEEIFVLYHDNELTEKEKLETEEFLSIHKKIKDEFDLIGLARLTPESSVVFPNKKILYKKEKSGKVVPVLFWRMLAAAVIIGFGLWIANLYFQKPVKSNIPIVHSIPVKNSLPKIEKNIVPEKKTIEVVAQSLELTNKNSEKERSKKKEKTLYQKNIVTKKSVKENNTNQLPEKISNETLVTNQEVKNITDEDITAINKIDPTKELAQRAVQSNNEMTKPDSYAKTVSYIENEDTNNQNYAFYDVTADKFKKTKVGGFLKKVKRVVERNNPIARLLSRDDRQVASK
jgi:hypothetical protein